MVFCPQTTLSLCNAKNQKSLDAMVTKISHVNDNAPEFVRKLHEIAVEENTPLGTEILRVMATSRDIGINAEISYSLQHTTQEKYLHIHPKTGVISIGGEVDFERVQQVVATIVATDGGTPPLSATALVNLTITDINDNAPVFTLPRYTATVREDALQGASVIQTLVRQIRNPANGGPANRGLSVVMKKKNMISLPRLRDSRDFSPYSYSAEWADGDKMSSSALSEAYVEGPTVAGSAHFIGLKKEDMEKGQL
ncbi:Protocadherin Fat 3 [Portunus trituberculatus]|uniref:Protocadherin Fat 3 n=1 Tax=Portunus trituberculatus TaxID=210409 RepID=A0A5B7DAF4_PORTR|nr:Protocadherin Fat 3 [Portunus trituberculatus]